MATATTNITATILTHHLQAIMARDLNEVMSDYADHSVILTANGAFKGREQIRAFFTETLHLLTPDVLSSIHLNRREIDGEFAYILWSAGRMIPFATDTFCIRYGKIVMQSFAAQFGH
jgi:ketosteroid isomerase-like protein